LVICGVDWKVLSERMHCSTQNTPKTVIRTNIYQYCQSFKRNSWIEGVSVALKKYYLDAE